MQAQLLHAAAEDARVLAEQLFGNRLHVLDALDAVEEGLHRFRIDAREAEVLLPALQHAVGRAEARAGVDQRRATEAQAERHGDRRCPQRGRHPLASVEALEPLERRAGHVLSRVVRPFLEHDDGVAELRELFRDHRAARTGSHNDDVGLFEVVAAHLRVAQHLHAVARPRRIRADARVGEPDRLFDARRRCPLVQHVELQQVDRSPPREQLAPLRAVEVRRRRLRLQLGEAAEVPGEDARPFEQPEEPKEHLARVAVPRDHGRVQALGDTDLRRGVADRASVGQQRFRERLQRREALLGEHLRPADGERPRRRDPHGPMVVGRRRCFRWRRRGPRPADRGALERQLLDRRKRLALGDRRRLALGDRHRLGRLQELVGERLDLRRRRRAVRRFARDALCRSLRRRHVFVFRHYSSSSTDAETSRSIASRGDRP